MSQTHAGKVVLVTGASRGIGRATARKFVAQGAKVFGVARNLIALDDLARELNAGDEKRFAFAAGDLTHRPLCEALPQTARETFGRLDVVVNNAGINQVGRIEELDPDRWEAVLRINLTAPFLITRAAFPILREAGGGLIVNVSSVSARQGLPKFPGFAAYCASKYGLQGLTDVACTEGKESNIRAVAVQPGSTDTDMLRETLPEAEADVDPEDVANVISFLATWEARKINGATIEIFP